MKKLLVLAAVVFQFCFLSEQAYSQDTCCISQFRPLPGMTFGDALSLCFINSEVECFTMSPPSLNIPIVDCPSNILENPHTYILFPSEDEFTLGIETENCQNAEGIQVLLYRLRSNPFTSDCANFMPDLSPEQLICDATTNRVEISQTGARDGIYYLVIDGFQGDICDYTIERVSGAFRSKLRDSLSLSGPQGVPEGYTATYSAEQFSFDCYRNFDCNCGFCSLDTFNVTWTGPPGTIINSTPGSLMADITFGSVGGSVCVRIKDDCENLLRCIPVEITPTEFNIKCPSEFVFAHGFTYGDPGIYYPRVDDYIYEVIVEDYAEELNVIFIDGCIGDQFQDCLSNTIMFPETDHVCSIIENDTCKTIQTFITWHQPLDTTLYDTICFGSSVFFCDMEISNAGTTDCDALSEFGCDSIVHLNLFILPPDSLFLFQTLCDGNDLLFCGQDIDQAGIFSCPDTSLDGCIQFTILEVSIDAIDTTYIDTTLCAPTEFTFLGNTYSSAGIYVVEELDAGNCLIRYVIDLMYDQVDTTFVTDTVCQMQPYNFCNMTLTDPGVYYCTFETSAACDSVVELTLISPCPGPDLVVLCAGEILEIGDTIIRTAGTYFIVNPISPSCSCIDTVTVQYVDLGNSEIMASNALNCDVDSSELSVLVDPTLNLQINEITWFDQNGQLSTTSIYVTRNAGQIGAAIEFSSILSGICRDTIYYNLLAADTFNPTLTWIDRELSICDPNQDSYSLSFDTDAALSILVLTSTGEQWTNETSIEIDFPIDTDVLSFQLTLSNESGECQEVISFNVERQKLDVVWPDTIFNSGAGVAATLPNPLFDQTASNIAISASSFISGTTNQAIAFNSGASGPFSLSFNIGDCQYEYQTFIITTNVFIPNAFSPNNDGINDVFFPFATDGIIIDELAIYNRWGGEVFSTRASDLGWNGRSNDKDMPAGIYVVRYTYSDGNGTTYTGVSDLLLIR